MKKILIRVAIGLVVVVVLVVLGVGLFLDSIAKKGIETVGPKVAKVDVKLNSIRLSLLSGSGLIRGLTVGNPPGYKTPHALSVNSIALGIEPRSLFSDKIVIHKLELMAPEITFEGGLSGNNLGKILANVNETTGGSGGTAPQTPPAETQPGKKLQVDDFVISGAKVTVSISGLNAEPKSVTISDIHFTDLGKGPEGITTAELLKVVLPVIEKEAIRAASSFPEFKKQLDEWSKSLDQTATGTVSNLTQRLDQATGGSMTNLTRQAGETANGAVSNALNNLFNKKSKPPAEK